MVQAFALQRESGLTGGIELVVFDNLACAVTRGYILFAGLHLAGRGEGADQYFFGVGDLGFGWGFDRRG